MMDAMPTDLRESKYVDTPEYEALISYVSRQFHRLLGATPSRVMCTTEEEWIVDCHGRTFTFQLGSDDDEFRFTHRDGESRITVQFPMPQELE